MHKNTNYFRLQESNRKILILSDAFFTLRIKIRGFVYLFPVFSVSVNVNLHPAY